MIEVKQTTEGQVVKQDTPQMITTTMIVNDLENGIDRPGIQEKYNLEAWEVKQMFMHPALKGKKAKKVRKLSFEFVDDTVDPNQTSIPVTPAEIVTEMRADSQKVDDYYQEREDIQAVKEELTTGEEDEEETDFEY